MNKMLYSINETAQTLGIGRSTLARLRKEGVIECVALGGRIMVTATEIERLLTELPKAPMGSQYDAAAVREWANRNGHAVGTRGRLSRELCAAYAAAQ